MPNDPSNYLIGGSLPFTSPNVGSMFNGNVGDLGNSYQSSYNTALAQNAANYQNIISGYQQTAQNQVSAQNAIGSGYGQLYNNVLGGIQNISASQKQAIQDVYAQQQGQAQQSLINSGLGNSTVTSSVNRGLTLDEQKAQVALSNQTAQLQAGYQSQLGQAGLNFQNQANMQNTALAGQQLGFQNSVSAMYPNAQMYAQLAQQAGATQQANLNRQLVQQLGSRALGSGGGGQLASNPSGMPNLGPMGGGGGSGAAGGMGTVTPYGMSGPSPTVPSTINGPPGQAGMGLLGGAQDWAQSVMAAGQQTPTSASMPTPYSPFTNQTQPGGFGFGQGMYPAAGQDFGGGGDTSF